ncbi:MAG: DNA polymerase IV, partial [Desulforhabdus sp.]|nr:DNA polymerase IV [Desulforhabdus sp.]
TGTAALHGSPRELSTRLKQTIYNQTSLTCSIGIAPNKFLAKIASDMDKPDGLTIIEEDDVADLLHSLPIARIPGIGKRTGQLLKDLGILTAADVLRFPLPFWLKRLGKGGANLYEKAQGIDSSPVTSHAEPKSCSAEDTFSTDLSDPAELRKWLLLQAQNVGRDLRRNGLFGRTVTVKIKFADFRVVTRSRTLQQPTNCTHAIFQVAGQLFDEVKISGKIRLTGVGVSNLCTAVPQLKLFPQASVLRQQRLDQAIDDIEARFGKKAVKRGTLFDFDPR